VKECIIEIFKHDCGACATNGAVFNPFSIKLEKHGYAQDLPCFRLDIKNNIPYLGQLGYSPMYFYVKKNSDNQIQQLEIISPPASGEKFLNKI